MSLTVGTVAHRVAERYASVGKDLLTDPEYNCLVFKAAVVECDLALIRGSYTQEDRTAFWPLPIILDAMNAHGYEEVEGIYAAVDLRDNLFGQTGVDNL